MRPASFLVIALACGAASANTAINEIAWTAGGNAALDISVPVSRFAEWCGKLRKGDQVAWQFESGEALDMNVHFHEGKAVHEPVKFDGVKTGKGTLSAASDQDYCWMWTNKSGRAVQLKASLRKLP